MNEAAEPEAAVKPQGKPLSLRRAKGILVGMTGFVLLVVAEGIHDIHAGDKIGAFLFCLLAAFWLLPLSYQFHHYLQVKKGVAVVLQPSPGSTLLVPFLMSVMLMILMTLLVTAASAVSYFIGFASPQPLNVRIIVAAVNVGFWLVVAFFWYRLMTQKQKRPQAKPILRQPEGVWPPAPQLPANEDMEFPK